MDTLFFIASKVVWGLIRPETWLVLGLGLTLVALLRGWQRAARWLGGLTLAFALAVAILPLGDLLIAPLESRYPPAPALDRVDGIVVLGGAEEAAIAERWGGTQLNQGAERFTGALALARRFPGAQVVFAGGSGRLRDMAGIETPESSVAESFFAGQGLDPERLLLESNSRNTAENAAFSLAVADPQPGERWVLVTSAFHMPRAMRSFARAGWPEMTAWPVDHRSRPFADGVGWDLADNLDLMDTALKEYLGLLVYGVTGR